MSDTFDSVYPDLLKTGLGKLNQLDGRHDLLALFSALEQFRRDLHQQESTTGILQLSLQYVARLDLFHTTGYWLVDPADFHFELTLVSPAEEQEALTDLIAFEIKSGRFARALRQGGVVFFQAPAPKPRLGTGIAASPSDPLPRRERPEDRGVFHSLAVSSQVIGMFCGLLRSELAPTNEITFSVLSLLLGASADALATLRKTTQLTNQINTLSGFLPVCAWCKKIRNDSGYWEQIERYISSRSAASFTHSICPDCQKKFAATIQASSRPLGG